MQKITKEELISIARMSRLQLEDQEVTSLVDQIDAVLNYALRVKDIAKLPVATELPSVKNRNIFREDVVIKTDPKDILAQAPECEQNYFVVPVILETT
jgi:aspartyl-tRNA(Asn)/glutamyl-tRNA(Gln) amidotransferase subunit C